MLKEEFEILKLKILKNDIEINIVSDSMYPFIKINQKLKVKALSEPLAIFDIIAFLGKEQKIYCHYVLKVLDDHVITAGTKTLSNIDEPILKDNILGIVDSVKLGLFFKLKVLLYFSLFKRV